MHGAIAKEVSKTHFFLRIPDGLLLCVEHCKTSEMICCIYKPEKSMECKGGIAYSDMENVRNFTRAGLFISRLYPKVRELCQFLNRDKTA